MAALSRLEKGFDYAPHFTFAWLTGELKQPRKASLVSSGDNSGLPADDLAGNLVTWSAPSRTSSRASALATRAR